MFHFLRNIRKRLLDSGATQRYLLYAIGEIALVMIGILLALQVNNWNETRSRNARLKVSLENLKRDLIADSTNWKDQRNFDVWRFYLLQHLLKLSGQQSLQLDSSESMIPFEEVSKLPYDEVLERFGNLPTTANPKFLFEAFRQSYRTGAYSFNTSTLEELKSTGLYSLLNEELKMKLNELVRSYDWRLGRGNEQLILRDRENWESSLIEEGVVPYDLSNVVDPLKLLSSSQKRSALLKRLIRNSRWRAMSMDVILQQTRLVLLEIDKELARLE